MAFERPLIERFSPSSADDTILRGIVSPCNGCLNNIPVPGTTQQADGLDNISIEAGWPCPKKMLYSDKEFAGADGQLTANYENPVYDKTKRHINPCYPGECGPHPYAYVWVATYEDNKDNGYNAEWDTARIKCTGPYLIKGTERNWHLQGHLSQEGPDEVIVTKKRYSIDGVDYMGFAEEAQVWQTARGYMREVDHNLGKSFSANGNI